MFTIASQYQMTHGLALLAVGWLAGGSALGGGRVLPNVAGIAFTLGIVLFCGSLYWFGINGLVPLQGSAPTGGILLMAGWATLMAAAVRRIAARS